MSFKSWVYLLLFLGVIVTSIHLSVCFLQPYKSNSSTLLTFPSRQQAEGDQDQGVVSRFNNFNTTSKPDSLRNEKEEIKQARKRRKEKVEQEKEDRWLEQSEKTPAKFPYDLENTQVGKFEAKYLFEEGKDDVAINSFEMLSSNEEFAKRYFIELDRKLLNGRILPFEGQVSNWLTGRNSAEADKVKKGEDAEQTMHTVSIVDTDVNHLKREVLEDPGFITWTIKRDGKSATVTTKESYKFTSVVFHPEFDKNNNLQKVIMKATQFEGKITLSVDRKGNLLHFVDKLTTKNAKKISDIKNISTFTADELQENGRLKAEFLKKLGISEKYTKYIVLDSQSDKFKKAKADLEEELIQKVIHGQNKVSAKGIHLPKGVCLSAKRGKRGVKCALYVKEDGEVEQIYPEEFVEAYKSSTEEDKGRLTELVKNNGDKIINVEGGGGTKMRKALNDLIHLEELKVHVGRVERVNEVHDVEKLTECWMTEQSEMLDKIHEKLTTGTGKVKLSGTKFASTLAESKLLRKGGHILGDDFLAHAIIAGILHNDTTSLAIIAARLSYDFGTEKLLEAGKVVMVFGEVAGPLGALSDIEFSVWSLTKDVGRLDNSTNKVDRDDAIADIVVDSITMAVAATTTILSLVFPPLASPFMTVGLVTEVFNRVVNAVVHAGDVVTKIVPHLEDEKIDELTGKLAKLFGRGEKNHFDYLVEEKQARDLAVQHNLWFLENNTNFAGIVFPSRTLNYDGGCHLNKAFCKCDLGPFGCTRWEKTVKVGEGCDLNRPCGYINRICGDYRENVPSSQCGYNKMSCNCDKNASTEFDNYPRRDNHVNFAGKVKLYWERAVPKDIEGGEFKCKPGLSYFLDYKLTQEDSREDYLCEAAVGLLQPEERRKEGQMMLFDLGEGQDSIILGDDDNTTNLFRVGSEGEKEFHGGAGTNIFLFDEACDMPLEGRLIGGPGDTDSIIIGDKCALNESLTFDFDDGIMQSSGGKVNLGFSSIEEIDGRQGQSEFVTPLCSTRKLVLRGGYKDNHDVIFIKDLRCSHNLTVVTTDFTEVYSETKQGNVTVVMDNSWSRVHIEGKIFPRGYTFNVIFSKTPSHQVKLKESLNVTKDGVSFTLVHIENDNSSTFKFKFQPEPEPGSRVLVEFPENDEEGKLYSVLMVSPVEPILVLYHNLPERQHRLERKGIQNVPGIFDITGHGWNVKGGEYSDKFILHHMDVFVEGGGGVDTVVLGEDISQSVAIDLRTKNLISSVEKVISQNKMGTKVTCGCDSKLVALKGGTEMHLDEVTVPEDDCQGRNLQIVARGHSLVNIAKNGVTQNDSVSIFAEEVCSGPINFKLITETNNVDALAVTINVLRKDWKVHSSTNSEHVTTLWEGAGGKSIELKLKPGNSTTRGTSPYLNLPYVQFVQQQSNEPPSQLQFHEDNHVSMLHILEDIGIPGIQGHVHGFTYVPNIFRVINGSWCVIGGDDDDLFVVIPSSTGRLAIDGGKGENTLILQKSSGDLHEGRQVFGADLTIQEFGYADGDISQLKSIHHFIGRENIADGISAGCEIKSISGKGGYSAEEMDIVFIPDSICASDASKEITVEVGSFTRLSNFDRKGRFIYLVEDILTTEFELYATNSNSHLLRFQLDPLSILKEVSFNVKETQLNFVLEGDSLRKLQSWNLSREANANFNNPIFQFHQLNSPITREIHVTRDGAVVATTEVRSAPSLNFSSVVGLPLEANWILLNMTDTVQFPLKEIRGSGGGRTNQVWIFNLEQSVAVLDGGECSLSISSSGCSVNHLYFANSFRPNENLDIDLRKLSSSIKVNGTEVAGQVKNFHVIQGRSGNGLFDAVTVVPTVQKVSQVEVVHLEFPQDNPYEILIQVDEDTRVYFDEPNANSSRTKALVKSKISYRFTTSRNFDLEGSGIAILGMTHEYFLPFILDDLEEIYFVQENERLYYKINGEEYSLSIISGPEFGDQFYLQPVMVTKDHFQLQVERDGSILLSMGAASSYSQRYVRHKLVPLFEETAQKLGVTMIFMSNTHFLHIGHGKLDGSRNFLQNVGHSESHLVGGGKPNTIYEIVRLDKDVFIYPSVGNVTWNDNMKQTVDLSDIIVPLRMSLDEKYVPVVDKDDKDLIISLGKHYHGRIYIVDGAIPEKAVKLQILLHNAMMDLQLISNHPPLWRIAPQAIVIPRGYVFAISTMDLEDGHHIQNEAAFFSHETSTYDFTTAKYNEDLVLTDIENFHGHEYTRKHLEMTTIIIKGFCKDEERASPFPSKVFNVTVSLPGLDIFLHEGRATVREKPAPLQLPQLISSLSPMLSLTNKSANRLSRNTLEKSWTSLVRSMEAEILQDLPQIPKVFVNYGKESPASINVCHKPQYQH